jgi:hypothetical protein
MAIEGRPVVGRTNGQGIHGLSGRQQRPLAFLRIQGGEDCFLAIIGVRYLEVLPARVTLDFQRVSYIPGAHQKQHAVAPTQIIEQSAKRTHDARKGPLIVSKREINQDDLRRDRRLCAISLLYTTHGLVNDIDDKPVGRRALTALGRAEYGPYVQGPRQRRLAVVEVTVDNQRRHLGAVLAFGYGVDIGKALRIVDS